MAKVEPLVVEFDASNRNPYFPPLDRKFRGRFSAALAVRTDKDAGELGGEWPEPIPGQHLAIDCDTGEAAVVEPLHDPRFKEIADRLKGKKLTLPPEREAVTCDLPTLLLFTQRAIKAGQARIVSGQIPPFDESKARQHFITQPHEDVEAKLATAMESQAAAFNRLCDVLERVLAKR